MITLVDYGVGNSDHSQYAERTSDPDIVASTHKLLLPGVSAFDHAMVELQAHGMVEAFNTCPARLSARPSLAMAGRVI